MDETDAFFTQTIVGAPFTVSLGRRRVAPRNPAQGLEIDPRSGESGLTQLWRDWVVLSHANDPTGRPRLRPGRVRGSLERHALWIALLGLLSLLASLVVWGIVQWN
ncbi:hypothetical protein H010_01685 [Hydrogenophaga taeniospiralis CCUG 15921]|uniref:Uncharacterized protein n=1 Tax=Hydrogenophaga taeniospiralis CCUG 15921 TaxID=1281780 RepID=A0A9X4NQ62_9BURK|nr:hypothetical protein [Hydrogenophaga taeniospiralis]MDG5973944.1 hypothetical protein [Hydrogenophaga taeniospiralis CCUG 15921]